MPCSGDDCNGQRMVERMRRVSGSLIFKGMNTGRSDRVKFGLPLFSYDGGVVLNPKHTMIGCAYGADGHIDDSYKVADGCGGPRCDGSNPYIEPNHCLCGFYNCGGSIVPWSASDLGPMLQEFVQSSSRYTGFGSYSGYNEIVIDSGTWLSNLPHSIEAIFLVDCSKRQRNTPYSASKSCEQAQANARRVHAAFLAAYGVPESKFPLLRLSQHEWDAPFAAAD